MHIFGLDFTSAPNPRKAITLAHGHFSDTMLVIDSQARITDFIGFESFLSAPGPWVAGLDFPFGQPRTLIENLDWPLSWDGYVSLVGNMGKAAFVAALDAYRAARPPGDKHHLRVTDRLAGAVSPMMLAGVPVGKMFFEGAPRLLTAGVSVLPCHPVQTDRTALEVYPALIARWAGAAGYKSDNRQRQSDQQARNRHTIINAVKSDGFATRYGFSVSVDREIMRAALADPTGDTLDAVLCVLQAAWAWSQYLSGWGIPVDADPLEGWIVDPHPRSNNAGVHAAS